MRSVRLAGGCIPAVLHHTISVSFEPEDAARVPPSRASGWTMEPTPGHFVFVVSLMGPLLDGGDHV
ncbi:hypothetical protein [Protofrankia coriariae]|uniref:Uncharacterized protein n=1 Tax=Protofrankia coriariae TaxID=1562887 RepID=A0ABR5EZF3_9ACTN|nr:hypothetical protein [Protofrankia coriariae]KLL09823.1 hypothetical protein FrCorBMG51_22215 [Protofrankia coriariae]